MEKVIYVLRYVSKENNALSSAIMTVSTDELAVKTEMQMDFEEDIHELKEKYDVDSFRYRTSEYAMSAYGHNIEIHYTITKHIITI